MNWRELWAETAGRVGERPAARWLCEVASGADRIEDVLDEPATERMVAHLDAMLARHAGGEPLAYVLGRWGFRHLDLAVDRRVLIPRPETEVVAGVAIELAGAVPTSGHGRPTSARVRGRSGWRWPTSCRSTASRCGSPTSIADALAVARANLAGIGRRAANVRIVEGSWFEALPDGVELDVAVSNPPYIADGSPDVDASVREWEPHDALFAGPDGLDAIRTLVAEAPARLRPGGWLVLEIGADQGAQRRGAARRGRLRRGVDPPGPRWPRPCRGRPASVIWAGSFAASEKIPAQMSGW